MKTKMNLFYHFTQGFLSVFWLVKPTLSISRKSGSRNDTENLRSDWINIGKDMQKSYEQFKTEHQ
jgi:hypothetical protein